MTAPRDATEMREAATLIGIHSWWQNENGTPKTLAEVEAAMPHDPEVVRARRAQERDAAAIRALPLPAPSPAPSAEEMAETTGRVRCHDPGDFDTFTEAIRAERARAASREAELAAKVERQESGRRQGAEEHAITRRERDEARAEVERLRAVVTKAKGALDATLADLECRDLQEAMPHEFFVAVSALKR